MSKIRPGANCELGCNEPPPDTGSVSPIGVFIAGTNDIVCFDGSQTNTDADGLSDFCEKNLAAAFAPQLALTKGSDNLGREPHWAAMKLVGTTKVRIMYLLSYYVDRGPSTSWCSNNFAVIIPGMTFDTWMKACTGHDGDSEWITLDVYYNRIAQRWTLDQAILSAHEGTNVYRRGTTAYPGALQYPGVRGGYPRIYVSYQKHANYGTDLACDSGSKMDTDDCNADLFQRVVAGDNVNIASRAVHRPDQDCWFSTSPIYSTYGKKECYWTSKQFLGWHDGYAGLGESRYTVKLADNGF
jgi:hypothetical protein